MDKWIAVVGTLGGTLVGAAITWRVERLRHRLQEESITRREKSNAYSAFLSALYQFFTTTQQVGEIGKLTSWITGPRNLRFLERSGLAAASTAAKDNFTLGYSLVLIWGSEDAKTSAGELLQTVQECIEADDEKVVAALMKDISANRARFLEAVHNDLGLPVSSG